MPKRMRDYAKSDYNDEVKQHGKDINNFTKDCRRRIGQNKEELRDSFECSRRIHAHHRMHCV